MAVTTRVKTNTHVQARIWSRATIYTANEVLRGLMEIVQRRGLDMGYMTDNLESIFKGLFTWTTMQCWKGACLEVCDASGQFAGTLRPDTRLRHASKRRGRILRHAHRDAGAEPGTVAGGRRYRVVVDLKEGAPSVVGWGETQFADTSHLRRQDFGRIIGTARINTSYSAWF